MKGGARPLSSHSWKPSVGKTGRIAQGATAIEVCGQIDEIVDGDFA